MSFTEIRHLSDPLNKLLLVWPDVCVQPDKRFSFYCHIFNITSDNVSAVDLLIEM